MSFLVRARDIWRDFKDGVSRLSGLNEPDKALIRQWGSEVENAIEALSAAAGLDPTIITTLRGEVADLRPYAGDLLGLCRVEGGGSNGGTVNTTAIIPSLTIPAGQTGNGSYLRIALPITAEDVSFLSGKTIEIAVGMGLTAGMLAVHPLSAAPVSLLRKGVFAFGSQLPSDKITGNLVLRTVRHTVIGDEGVIGVDIGINGTSTSSDVHTLFVGSVSYRVVDDADNSATGPGGSSLAVSRSMHAAELSGIGVRPRDLVYNPVAVANGAYTFTIGGPPIIVVPAGSTGRGSYVVAAYSLDPYERTLLRGAKIRVTMDLDTVQFHQLALTPDVQVLRASTGGGEAPVDRRIVSAGLQRTGLWRAVLECTLPSDANDVRFVFFVDAGATQAPVTATQQISLRYCDITVLAPPDRAVGFSGGGFSRTAADVGQDLRASRLARRVAALSAAGYAARNSSYDQALIVPDTLASVSAAVAYALADAGVNNRWEVQFKPGSYEGPDNFNADKPNHIDFRGWNRDLCIVNGIQANNTALADIAAKSTLNCNYGGRISGLTARVTNGRYALHCDPLQGAPNSRLIIEDCRLIHDGNAGAVAYQTGLGASGNPGGVWVSQSGAGFGMSDGGELVWRRDEIIGAGFTALIGHNNQSFAAPSRLLIEQCVLDPRADPTAFNAYSLQYGQLGNRQGDTIEMVGCVLPNPVALALGPWTDTSAAAQIANKCAGLIWSGHSNSPTPFLLLDDGSRALRIDSAATGTASSIVVTGSAVAVLFGDTVSVTGDAGISGGVYGTWDVGQHGIGLANNINSPTLGMRLGDCTAVNKTLQVYIDGNQSPVIITFNQNYTTASNASILGAMNTALSGAIASLVNVNDRFRPYFMDEETRITNTGSTTIVRKMGVAYDTSTATGRVATSSDAAINFAGIAYETIRPGKSGRIKRSGAVRVSQDMIRSDNAAFQRGALFGIGSTPGMFVLNPTIAVMRATNSMDAAFFSTASTTSGTDLSSIQSQIDSINARLSAGSF